MKAKVKASQEVDRSHVCPPPQAGLRPGQGELVVLPLLPAGMMGVKRSLELFFLFILGHAMAKGPGHQVHVQWAGSQHELSKAGLILVSHQADISGRLHFYSIMAMPLTNRLTSKSHNAKGAAVGRCWSPQVKVMSAERGLRAWRIQLRFPACAFVGCLLHGIPG